MQPPKPQRQRKRKHYIPEWMQYARKTNADVIDATGAGKDLVSKWKNQGINPTEEYKASLAALLGTTPEGLYTPPGPLVTPVPERRVFGPVGAGGDIIGVGEDTSDLPMIPVLAGEIDGAGIVEIRGPSLGPFEGWYAVIGPRLKFRDELYGRLCVVQTLEDQQVFIKWVHRTRRKGVKLVSGDGEVERDGVELEWAAPVIGMRPR